MSDDPADVRRAVTAQRAAAVERVRAAELRALAALNCLDADLLLEMFRAGRDARPRERYEGPIG